MRIQPRQQLLDTWRATALASYDAEKQQWRWGGREASNSISDAEQLLCIMLPATDIPRFRLDRPDQADEEVLRSLRHLGDAIEVPRLLVRVIVDYLRRYSHPDGTPDFSGGSYFTSPDDNGTLTAGQAGLDVVESFASSITLMLSAIGFAKVFKPQVQQAALLEELNELEQLASKRLSAAMVGLLRSFAINVFADDTTYGKVLTRTVNQTRQNERRATDGLRRALRDVAAGLRDLNIGIARVSDLDQPGRLFECGWSWGVTVDAPPVDADADIGKQRDGYALDEPYLYFTVVALDGISELFSERTRRLGLLTDEQQRLSTNLRLRWDLTQQYWATIASYGTGRWPLEDIPWRTVDEVESDYYSLLVTSIAARDLAVRRDTDADLSRLGLVLAELANRGRITRRPAVVDGAVALHHPGVVMELFEPGPVDTRLRWIATDFSPLLLKRAIYIASQINNIELRGQLLELVDDVWEHVAQRRFRTDQGIQLWDQPSAAFNAIDHRFTEPSWHHTVRVVESLVLAANMAESHPLRSERLIELAQDLAAEAEHLLDQERLAGSAESGRAMRSKIDVLSDRLIRSHEIMNDKPSSATALLLSVLRELDDLAVARPDDLGDS